MKSLFVRIFLSYWLAQALFLVLAVLVTLVFHSQRDTSVWDAMYAKALRESADAYEHGGQEASQRYLEDLEDSQQIRAFLFNDQGVEVSRRVPREWAQFMLHEGSHGNTGFWQSLMPNHFLRQTATLADGKHYTLVVELPRGPRVFFGPHGIPGLGMVIAILTSGLVCYLLARSLTSPVMRLREATQKIAAGDLSARAGGSEGRHDDLGELVRDFDSMASRLEGLVNAQSRLLSDISHELRSPLARLSVALGLARQRTGPEAQSALERIDLETGRLNELIGRLLTIARLEGGEETMQKFPIRLDELIEEIAKDADFEAQGRNCRVRFKAQDECVVEGDPALLHSAIENVVRNATRYTRPATEVQIELTRGTELAKPMAVIRVSDWGPGVPHESLEKLFRPFYRIDDARVRNTGGVGLGLAITERAVVLHGGSVSATNRAEGGLVVELHLPLVEDTSMPSDFVGSDATVDAKA